MLVAFQIGLFAALCSLLLGFRYGADVQWVGLAVLVVVAAWLASALSGSRR